MKTIMMMNDDYGYHRKSLRGYRKSPLSPFGINLTKILTVLFWLYSLRMIMWIPFVTRLTRQGTSGSSSPKEDFLRKDTARVHVVHYIENCITSSYLFEWSNLIRVSISILRSFYEYIFWVHYMSTFYEYIRMIQTY